MSVVADLYKFYGKLHLVDVAVQNELTYALAAGKSQQVELGKVHVKSDVDADATRKLGLRLQFDNHIAEQVCNKTARVVGFDAVAVEIHQTADRKIDILVIVLRSVLNCIEADVLNGLRNVRVVVLRLGLEYYLLLAAEAYSVVGCVSLYVNSGCEIVDIGAFVILNIIQIIAL